MTAGSRDPRETAVRLADHLSREYRYSLALERRTRLASARGVPLREPGGQLRVLRGCLAVMLRSQGVPARVVGGFQRGEWNPVRALLHGAHARCPRLGGGLRPGRGLGDPRSFAPRRDGGRGGGGRCCTSTPCGCAGTATSSTGASATRWRWPRPSGARPAPGRPTGPRCVSGGLAGAVPHPPPPSSRCSWLRGSGGAEAARRHRAPRIACQASTRGRCARSRGGGSAPRPARPRASSARAPRRALPVAAAALGRLTAGYERVRFGEAPLDAEERAELDACVEVAEGLARAPGCDVRLDLSRVILEVRGVDPEPVLARVAPRLRVPPHACPCLRGQPPQQDDGVARAPRPRWRAPAPAGGRDSRSVTAQPPRHSLGPAAPARRRESGCARRRSSPSPRSGRPPRARTTRPASAAR